MNTPDERARALGDAWEAAKSCIRLLDQAGMSDDDRRAVSWELIRLQEIVFSVNHSDPNAVAEALSDLRAFTKAARSYVPDSGFAKLNRSLDQLDPLGGTLPEKPSEMQCASQTAPRELTPVEPPRVFEFLFRFFAEAEGGKDAVLGDVAERYTEMVHRYNKLGANLWYLKQVGKEISPAVKKLAGILAKWTIFRQIGGWVVDVFHH